MANLARGIYNRLAISAPRRISVLGARALSTSSGKKNLDWLESNGGVQDKHVLIRADLNVPLDKSDSSKITDDTRIKEFLPTLEALLNQNAKVVVCSHLGRPKGKVNEAMRLTPVAKRMEELLSSRGKIVSVASDCVGDDVKLAASKLRGGEVLLLENLRFHAEEEKNTPEFAQQLQEASMAQIYVNDAFGTAHRAHASTEGVTKYIDTCVAGKLMEKELHFLKGAIDKPVRPMSAILGGAKVSSKLPVIESLMAKCDTILLGGAMIFTFFKARGMDVGKSLVEDSFVAEAKRLEQQAKDQGIKLLLPTDVVVATEMSSNAATSIVDIASIPSDSMGLDIGPKSIDSFVAAIAASKTIVWNGPMGAFEFEPFAAGTNAIAHAVAKCTATNGATTIIGGGDSVAAVHQAGVADQVSHISTGGGASLEMLEGKVLPGVAALDDL